jgi:hypothetical protein
MESQIFSNEQSNPMETLKYYLNDCSKNIEIAQHAAKIIGQIHTEEVSLTGENLDTLTKDIGSETVADL